MPEDWNKTKTLIQKGNFIIISSSKNKINELLSDLISMGYGALKCYEAYQICRTYSNKKIYKKESVIAYTDAFMGKMNKEELDILADTYKENTYIFKKGFYFINDKKPYAKIRSINIIQKDKSAILILHVLRINNKEEKIPSFILIKIDKTI